MIFLQILVFPEQPDERPDDLVDAKYVAARFGCSVRSVQARKCGTAEIARVTDDPLRFRRGDVDAALRARLAARQERAPAQKAIRLLERKARKRKVA